MPGTWALDGSDATDGIAQPFATELAPNFLLEIARLRTSRLCGPDCLQRQLRVKKTRPNR